MSLTALVRATKTALSSDPALAQAKFEAHHSAVGATKVTVRVGSGRQLTVDELGGGNVAANPVEYALAALGSFQAITYRIWAAQLGIKLDKVEIHVDGDIDLRGLFGLDGHIRAGFKAVRIRVGLRGPEPADHYEELATAVDTHCPPLDLFRNPVPIKRELVSANGRSVVTADQFIEPFSVPMRARPHRENGVLSAGDIDLDRQNWRVRRAGRGVQMGPKEFRLLEHLMARPGQVFSRAQLVDSVWGLSAEIDERTVDVHIGRLRKALSRGDEEDPIRTVRGAGYAFDETFGRVR
jgi:DNA-binding response OmpR family regulator